MPGLRPARRTVLLGMLAGGLAACIPGQQQGDDEPSPPDPDEVITGRVVADERALLAAYQTTVERHPQLAARLRPIADEHAAHLTALGASSTPATSTTSPSATPSQTPAVAATPAAAVAALVALERAAALGRVSDVGDATPELARLLAGLGGSEASHATLLAGAS